MPGQGARVPKFPSWPISPDGQQWRRDRRWGNVDSLVLSEDDPDIGAARPWRYLTRHRTVLRSVSIANGLSIIAAPSSNASR